METTLHERLVEAFEESGKTKAELARFCGVSHPSVINWLNGRTKQIGGEHLVKAAQFLGVSSTWLATGIGEKIPGAGNVIAAYDEDATPEGFVAIPEYRIQCGAGTRDAPTFEEATETKPAYYREDFFQSHGTKPEECKRFKVHGDSMYPILFDGDTILVDCRYQRIISGKIYVFCFGNEVRVKRLHTRLSGGLLVQSENPSVPDEEIPASEMEYFHLIGRVIDRSGSSPF